ncbi:hypothetical protein JVX99_29270 [Pseudomonas aeruginosa]|uniref:hypothetical protein n=1 Tax=Pseudomonas aeruginosa TaxID=287 RepID=UPI001AFC2A70|nr:hypothetical protein [Pseudomonas aeruginosa]QRY73883.1 hypothetical protein JVX99_29270 [Pseudomonas aeruginosa]
MIKNDSQAPSCTCPSGDGSLVHPCPAHPAVEQVGGDERAAFEAWATHLPMDRQPLRPDLYMPQTQWAWEAWQFRAALAQPSPAPELAERGTQHRFSTTEQTCRHDFAGVWWNDNGVTKTGRECRHCGFFVADAPEVQAEAERPELWAVHAQGPDELYAAFTREDAEKHAAELNALPMPEGIAVGAVVVPSPWPAVQHWQYLAEQEQDHKNEIAGRLRQLERICEGLPQDAIDGGWTVQGIRGYAKRLEDQLKAAQAEVEALRAELQSQRERNTELIFKLGSATNGWGRCEKERDAALARAAELEGKLAELEKPVPTHGEHSELRRIAVALKNPLLSGEEASDLMVRYEALTMPDHIIALIDRQAQHSVPSGWKLVPLEPTPEMLDARRDCEDGMDGYLVEDTEYYFPGRDAVRAFLARVYRGLIAAAPAPGGER